MEENFVFLTVVSDYEVDLVCQKLKEAGIRYLVKDYTANAWQRQYGGVGLMGKEILVRESELVRAKELLGTKDKEPPFYHGRKENFIWKLIGGVAVIFAGISIIGNFLFTPKLFQKFAKLFPIIFSKKLFIILFLISIVFAGGVFAWQYLGIPREKIQLNIEQIENAEIYSGIFKEKVQLVDGKYERRYPEGASELYVQIDNNSIVFSDLDNDGIKEAVLITYWSGGGSGTWRELTIIKNEMGHPLFITSKDLGDRTIINSLTIESGIITVDMVAHSPSDPMCCPTQKEVAKYKLADTELIEMTESSVPSITVTILSPNGGEVLELGKPYQINWTCSDVLPVTSSIARIHLLLDEQIPYGTIDGTPEAYSKIAGCSVEGGKFLWKVGEVERGTISSGNKYRVKVNVLAVSDDKEEVLASDISDNYFSIIK